MKIRINDGDEYTDLLIDEHGIRRLTSNGRIVGAPLDAGLTFDLDVEEGAITVEVLDD